MNRNTGIDFFRLLISFFVVGVHAMFSGIVGEYVAVIGKTGVAFFFIITGYYYKEKNSKRSIIKILKITLLSNLCYVLYYLILGPYLHDAVSLSQLSVQDVAVWLFWGDNPLAVHLWYLSALLFALIFFHYCFRFIKNKTMLCTVLVIAGLLLGQYSELWSKWQIPPYISRSWLFEAVPFMLIGNIIAQKKVKGVGLWKCLAGMSVSLLLLLLEYTLLRKYNCSCRYAIFAMSVPLTVCTFVFALNLPYFCDNRILHILAAAGKKYSLMIYIGHWACLPVGYKLSALLHMEKCPTILSFIVSLFFAITVTETGNYLKKLRITKN